MIHSSVADVRRASAGFAVLVGCAIRVGCTSCAERRRYRRIAFEPAAAVRIRSTTSDALIAGTDEPAARRRTVGVRHASDTMAYCGTLITNGRRGGLAVKRILTDLERNALVIRAFTAAG